MAACGGLSNPGQGGQSGGGGQGPGQQGNSGQQPGQQPKNENNDPENPLTGQSSSTGVWAGAGARISFRPDPHFDAEIFPDGVEHVGQGVCPVNEWLSGCIAGLAASPAASEIFCENKTIDPVASGNPNLPSEPGAFCQCGGGMTGEAQKNLKRVPRHLQEI